MRFSTVVALASVAVAAPLEKRGYTTTWVVDTVTVYTTVYATPASSASAIGALQQSSRSVRLPSTTSTPPPPKSTTSTYVPPPPSKTSTYVPPPPSTTSVYKAPASPSTTTVSTPAPSAPIVSGQCSTWDPNQSLNTSPVDCGVPIIDTINKWRVKYGKSELTWASNLAQAAQYTVQYNQGGVTEVHPGLRDGSFGECITPGFWETGNLATQGLTPFEVGLMGWLCEVSSDPQLQASANNGVDVCSISRNVASISGSNNPNEPHGHHDIFLSDSYTKIGCWFEYDVNGDGGWPQFAGQHACDFSW